MNITKCDLQPTLRARAISPVNVKRYTTFGELIDQNSQQSLVHSESTMLVTSMEIPRQSETILTQVSNLPEVVPNEAEHPEEESQASEQSHLRPPNPLQSGLSFKELLASKANRLTMSFDSDRLDPRLATLKRVQEREGSGVLVMA